ncbi:MAG TPA: hypothetical protein VG147_06670 [Solirubrobacteraceae bacterium]|nr:hypothetical protein [Solirubrobacteraceae bacterium]
MSPPLISPAGAWSATPAGHQTSAPRSASIPSWWGRRPHPYPLVASPTRADDPTANPIVRSTFCGTDHRAVGK